MSLSDEQAIRALVQDWAVWRDAGDWERFATVWHDDGVMMATWFQGPAPEFIRVSREGFERGVRILHFLGGTSVDITDDARRAVAQTKMTITQDQRFFAPLADLKPGGARVFLGIVLPLDGVSGLRRRRATAGRFLDGFGVAMYCGFGRQPGRDGMETMREHRRVVRAAVS